MGNRPSPHFPSLGSDGAMPKVGLRRPSTDVRQRGAGFLFYCFGTGGLTAGFGGAAGAGAGVSAEVDVATIFSPLASAWSTGVCLAKEDASVAP